MEKTREELVKEFRQAFKNLPEKDKTLELKRLIRITEHIPIVVFEDWETGKTLKFPDIKNVMEYLWQAKKIRSCRSMIYKCLRGQYATAYGFKMHYTYEEE